MTVLTLLMTFIRTHFKPLGLVTLKDNLSNPIVNIIFGKVS